jgi:hypothetical protein
MYEKLLFICKQLGWQHPSKNIGEYKDKKIYIDIHSNNARIYVRFGWLKKKLVKEINNNNFAFLTREGRWSKYIDILYDIAMHKSKFADDEKIFPNLG